MMPMLKLRISEMYVFAHCFPCDPNSVEIFVSHSMQTPSSGDGAYNWAFETSNGISQEESGVGGQNAQGSANWYSPEGEPVQLSYVADEFGYRVAGSHLPTPPPVPAAIQRAIEYIRTHPSEESQPQQQQRFF